MKYSIGYRPPLAGQPSAADLAARHDCIDEVYYPWPRLPSGRSPLSAEHRERLEADLTALRERGVSLNLLLNASCWGARGFTRTLADELAGVIGRLADRGLVDSVTVCSPMIARLVKQNFPRLGVRASVNMKIGSIGALEQVGDLFDGLTIAREYNHDLGRLAELGAWCAREGKHMQLLANSGCIPDCPVQMFHDNLVSHENSDDAALVADRFADHIPGGCWEFFSRPSHRVRLLAGSWIRPEDVHHYESVTARLKLATRMHARAATVVRAYARGRFGGNLLDLLEPGHGRLIAPCVIDNTRFPADWFERITQNSTREAMDEYYREVYDVVLVNTGARE